MSKDSLILNTLGIPSIQIEREPLLVTMGDPPALPGWQ